VNFAKLPRKTKLLEKFRLLTRKDLNSQKGKEPIPAPQPTFIHKLSVTPMVWNICTGQLGCLSGYAPSQLLHTSSLAEYKKLEQTP